MVGTRVYVGGLSYRVSERDIDKFFKGFSGVGDIVIKNGFAFVEFDDNREAEDAIYEMNGKELMGGRVTVEKAKGTPRTSRWPRGGGGGGGGGGRMQRRMPQQRSRFEQDGRYAMPSRTNYRLTVSNLSSQVSWQDLKDFMRQGGEVTYADAHKQRKNEGVIEFATRSDMRNALSKLDGKELCGRRIRLYKEESRRDGKSRSRSRSRSRSPYSRSKSRSASRSRSRSNSRPRSYSPKREKSRSKSKSRSRSRSNTPANRRSASRSMSRDRDRDRDGGNDERRSDSRSPTPQNDKNNHDYD